MIRTALIALALSALSLCWRPAGAQQTPQQPSAAAALSGQMATLLSSTLEERDTCRAQLAAAQAPHPPAAPAQPPAQTPEGAKP